MISSRIWRKRKHHMKFAYERNWTSIAPLESNPNPFFSMRRKRTYSCTSICTSCQPTRYPRRGTSRTLFLCNLTVSVFSSIQNKVYIRGMAFSMRIYNRFTGKVAICIVCHKSTGTRSCVRRGGRKSPRTTSCP